MAGDENAAEAPKAPQQQKRVFTRPPPTAKLLLFTLRQFTTTYGRRGFPPKEKVERAAELRKAQPRRRSVDGGGPKAAQFCVAPRSRD